MQHVINFTPMESDKILSHRKEKSGLHKELALIDLDTGKAAVIARIYWPATVVYCCVWIHHGEHHSRGAGKAGGGGYHKPSAAMQEALRDAGIELAYAIGGRGDSAMRESLEAIARYFGIARFMVHEAHP